MTPPEPLNLKQVAALLGVHYMTAYRYVRQGRLEAERHGTEWRVTRQAVEGFRAAASPNTWGTGVDWPGRLVEPLVAGDEAAAWQLIDAALASGRTPEYCYLDMIAAAIADIDRRWTCGEVDAAQQPLAIAVANRLVARLGSRFRRTGRSKGSVIFGSPQGERHQLPVAIVADLVRLAGYDVLELGTDLPPDAFAAAIGHARRLVAVGLSVTHIDHLDSAIATVAAIRAATDAPIIVGGQAVLNPELAELLDADAWAPDGRSALTVIESLVQRTGSHSKPPISHQIEHGAAESLSN